jgi:hypothetical protein
MEQSAIPSPRFSSGPGYSIFYQAFLHVGGGLLRKTVSHLTGAEQTRQRKLVIKTPSIGAGTANISVWTPAGYSDSHNALPLVLVLEGGGFILGQPKDGQRNNCKIADEVIMAL